MFFRLLAGVLLVLLIRAATAAVAHKPKPAVPAPAPAPAPVQGPAFDGPLTPAEVDAMVKDGPGIVRVIAAQNLLIVNGTMITKSFMDAVMPEIQDVLRRVDELQRKLPSEIAGTVRVDELQKQFERQWFDANSSYTNSSAAMQIKYLVEQIQFNSFPETVKTMSLQEQANMRAMFTTARERVVQITQLQNRQKYIEATDQSISVLYNTLRELMGAEKDLKFLLAHERTRKEAARLLGARTEEVRKAYQRPAQKSEAPRDR